MTFRNRIHEAEQLKQEIDARRPLPAPAMKQLRDYYRVGLTYASNALEGSGLTESETRIVLEDGITIGGKQLKEHLEAIGHAEAYDLLYRLARQPAITEKNVRDLHRLFYFRIDPRNAGRYRKIGVVITGSTMQLPRPGELKPRMQEMLVSLQARRASLHPIELAALLHIGLANIHPFLDGNGRTARLLMNLALLQAGYPITIIPPVVRHEYIDALKASNRGENQPFINLVSSMVRESLLDYRRLLSNLAGE
ncbi:MAG: Fic family protein [Thermodesulfobacteriota bacterium]